MKKNFQKKVVNFILQVDAKSGLELERSWDALKFA